MYWDHSKRYHSRFYTALSVTPGYQKNQTHQWIDVVGDLTDTRYRFSPHSKSMDLLNRPSCTWDMQTWDNQMTGRYINAQERKKKIISNHCKEMIHIWRKPSKPHTLRLILINKVVNIIYSWGSVDWSLTLGQVKNHCIWVNIFVPSSSFANSYKCIIKSYVCLLAVWWRLNLI